MDTNKKLWIGVLVLLTLSLKSFAEVRPLRIVLGPIVKKGDPGTENYCRSAAAGDFCMMPQHTMPLEGRAPILGAVEYCASLGAGHRLPNIYELAIGMSSDPLFVRIIAPEPMGYYRLVMLSELQFFYDNTSHYRHSHEGEPAPRENWYWSSSLDNRYSGNAYYFNAESGDIATHTMGNAAYIPYSSAVRCVESIQTQN